MIRMTNYNRDKRILYFCLSIFFFLISFYDNNTSFLSLFRSIIGLFLGTYAIGDELRSWVFQSSSSKIDYYEVFAINIAFSISILIILGAILSMFNAFTSLGLSITIALFIAVSSVFGLIIPPKYFD